MSLILDALRKAEADRQRGAVPGLHAVPTTAPSPPPAAPALRGLGWPLAAALLALGAAVVAWLLLRPATPAGAGAGATSPAAAPAAAPATAPANATVPPAAPPPAALPSPPPLPLVVSAPPAATPAPAATTPPPPATPATPAARPAPILTQVRRLAELPAEQRRELPPLVVSGSVWSEQAAARFVVLDGQVLREGDSLAPGLVLVKLAPRAATLRWRDSLVEVPF